MQNLYTQKTWVFDVSFFIADYWVLQWIVRSGLFWFPDIFGQSVVRWDSSWGTTDGSQIALIKSHLWCHSRWCLEMCAVPHNGIHRCSTIPRASSGQWPQTQLTPWVWCPLTSCVYSQLTSWFWWSGKIFMKVI